MTLENIANHSTEEYKARFKEETKEAAKSFGMTITGIYTLQGGYGGAVFATTYEKQYKGLKQRIWAPVDAVLGFGFGMVLGTMTGVAETYDLTVDAINTYKLYQQKKREEKAYKKP